MNFTGQTAKNQKATSEAEKKRLLLLAEKQRKEAEKARKKAMKK